jgi:hypothetical protein
LLCWVANRSHQPFQLITLLLVEAVAVEEYTAQVAAALVGIVLQQVFL